jgi:toxin FitB
MSGITILDTNVVSEPMRPSPSAAVLAWLSRKPDGGHFFVTTITMAEILFGIELLLKGKRRDKMLAEAEAMFAEDFAGRILPFDEAAARAFPEIAIRRRAQGRAIADLDAQIAAIARSRDAILATRNTADFEGCGIRLVNPWQLAER